MGGEITSLLLLVIRYIVYHRGGGGEATPVTTACPEHREGKTSYELTWNVKVMINVFIYIPIQLTSMGTLILLQGSY